MSLHCVALPAPLRPCPRPRLRLPQIQDDFLDAFADPSVLGKVGTDVQDNKCSWLVVQALARATPEQKALLKADYGRHDDAAVARVKALYHEMGLKALYEAYEEETYA